LAKKAGADLGEQVMRMQTKAGHVSVSINTMAPAVMIFIPSAAGVSHCEREFTSDEDMAAGLRWLIKVIQRMVHGDLDGVSYPGHRDQYEKAQVKETV